MRIQLRAHVLSPLLSLACLACFGAQRLDLQISPLLDQDRAEGCGCYFEHASRSRSRSREYVLWDGYTGQAWVNLFGVDELLTQEDTPQLESKVGVGSRFQMIYRSTDTAVTLDLVVTSACTDDDESCEYTGLAGKLTADVAGNSATIPIVGGCGC